MHPPLGSFYVPDVIIERCAVMKSTKECIDETQGAEYDEIKKGVSSMKENISKTLSRARWGSIALILFGLVLVIYPDFGSKTVAGIIAWILMGIGILGLVVGVLSWPAFGFGTLAGSALSLVIGFYIMRSPLSLASILGVLLGALLTVQGLGALGDTLRLRRNGQLWIPGLIWSILTLVLGLILIFSPMTTSRVVMTVVGIIMILCGAGNLYTHAKVTPFIRPTGEKGKIIDADE